VTAAPAVDLVAVNDITIGSLRQGASSQAPQTSGSIGLITLAGSRMYTSMADTDAIIDDALGRFDNVLSSVEG
jgi:hypothetical protein